MSSLRLTPTPPPMPPPDYPYTKDAVKIMLQGISCSRKRTPIIGLGCRVKLMNIQPVGLPYGETQANNSNYDNFCFCYVHDGEHTHEAIVYIGSYDIIIGMGDLFVEIEGYITSSANYMPRVGKQRNLYTYPFLCITAFHIFDVCRSLSVHQLLLTLDEKTIYSPPTVSGGCVGSFLECNLPYLTVEDLSGYNMKGVFGSPIYIDEIHQIADFISHHKAKLLLSGKDSTVNDNYLKAVSSFASDQLNRQSASLTTNAGRESAENSELIVTQNSDALAFALEHASTSQQQLTKENLCIWHMVLGYNNIIPNAGKIRIKDVRAGSTSFGPHNEVNEELDLFCSNLRSLEQILFQTSTTAVVDNSDHVKQYGLAPILFAAVAMYGVIDIHPFDDGNGRLGRLVANWALCRGGLPFAINLCVTPSQRSEYITAIELTRRNMNLIPFGDTPPSIFNFVQQGAGLFKPMVEMIMDRACRATAQCQNIINEKSTLQSEEEEARAARRHREKSAEGTCLICFDDKPNIATLCCGKAVHINCIAQWLSSSNSCPACRSNLPSLSRQISMLTYAPGGNNINLDDIDTTGDVSSDSNNSLEPRENMVVPGREGDSNVEDASPIVEEIEDITDETDQNDSTASTLGDTIMFFEDMEGITEEMDRHDTRNQNTMSSTTDEMTTAINTTEDRRTEAMQQIIYCSFCPNRAAVDCTNVCCGRCCVLHGFGMCPRHGVDPM